MPSSPAIRRLLSLLRVEAEDEQLTRTAFLVINPELRITYRKRDGISTAYRSTFGPPLADFRRGRRNRGSGDRDQAKDGSRRLPLHGDACFASRRVGRLSLTAP